MTFGYCASSVEAMSPATPQTRELAARDSDGLSVRLLWHRARTRSRSRSRTRAAEIASTSRSRPTAPSMPSTTPSPMPPNEGRSGPAERRTVMFRTDHISRRNLAARMGSWSASHWKAATFGWLALVLLAFAVGSQVGTKQADPTKAGPGESGRMDRILDAGFKLPADESVLIQNRSLRAGTPAFDAAVKDVVTRLGKVAAVKDVRSPLDAANGAQIAKGRRAALVEFEIRGDSTKAADKLSPVLKSVADAQHAHPGFFVGEFGGASAAKAVDTAFANDLKSAGVFSVPLTLIILVVAFGALVAAGIPLLLALTAVFATFGLAALPSHLLPLAPEALAVVLLVGLAVGGSLTVLPALLSKLGDRVERLQVPLVGRLRRDNGEGRVWGAIVERVLRRPLLSAVVAAGLLLALAAPALQLRMEKPGPDTLPKSLTVVKTYNRMQQAFPGKA